MNEWVNVGKCVGSKVGKNKEKYERGNKKITDKEREEGNGLIRVEKKIKRR